jgi:hypothetical protein
MIAKVTTAREDSTVTISSRKAKEINVRSGDIVVLVGRRRNASYAQVAIGEKAFKNDDSCSISQNLAYNLRLRQDDKVKVVPMKSMDHEEPRSGDLLLMKAKEVAQVTSVSFAPVDDSLNALTSSEGGDDLSDDEILERFVRPYLNSNDGNFQLLKKGHLISLRDESGRRLEFYVSQMELEDTEDDDGKTEGKFVKYLI